MGRYQEALELGLVATDWLAEQVDDRDEVALTLTGMLYLRMAAASSRRQDRETTNDFLRRAHDAGQRLGYDANLWHTGFGPTDVVLGRFSAALSLGDISFVVEKGPQLRVDHMPSVIEAVVGRRETSSDGH